MYVFINVWKCFHFCIHNIVAESTGNSFLNASQWNNPQEITGKFPGYLSPSAGLKFADVPNGLAAISKVPAAGQGFKLAVRIQTEQAQWSVKLGWYVGGYSIEVNDDRIICNSFSVIIPNMLFWWSMWLYLEVQYWNLGGWGQILAYMAFCEVSQDQSPGTPAAAGDFGFKVLTASDPAEKTKKLSAELANGRLAMMAIIGMFFQAGIGFCKRIVCSNLQRKETPHRSWMSATSAQQFQHMWIRKHNFVISHVVFWVSEVFFSPAMFSAHHMFDCLILFQHSAHYCAMSPVYLHMPANKVSCRMYAEHIASWCDMHRLYHW